MAELLKPHVHHFNQTYCMRSVFRIATCQTSPTLPHLPTMYLSARTHTGLKQAVLQNTSMLSMRQTCVTHCVHTALGSYVLQMLVLHVHQHPAEAAHLANNQQLQLRHWHYSPPSFTSSLLSAGLPIERPNRHHHPHSAGRHKHQVGTQACKGLHACHVDCHTGGCIPCTLF